MKVGMCVVVIWFLWVAIVCDFFDLSDLVYSCGVSAEKHLWNKVFKNYQWPKNSKIGINIYLFFGLNWHIALACCFFQNCFSFGHFESSIAALRSRCWMIINTSIELIRLNTRSSYIQIFVQWLRRSQILKRKLV